MDLHIDEIDARIDDPSSSFDWEATGSEEYERILQNNRKSEQKLKTSASVEHIRYLLLLVELRRFAVNKAEHEDISRTQEAVANLIIKYVGAVNKSIVEGLSEYERDFRRN